MKENTLKLFICIRGEYDWEGALIVLAESEEEAVKMYVEYEAGHETDDEYYRPTKVIEVPLNKKGIVYDDYAR